MTGDVEVYCPYLRTPPCPVRDFGIHDILCAKLCGPASADEVVDARDFLNQLREAGMTQVIENPDSATAKASSIVSQRNTQPWPLVGGTPSPRPDDWEVHPLLLLTAHPAGLVKVWDASCPYSVELVYVIDTSSYFADQGEGARNICQLDFDIFSRSLGVVSQRGECVVFHLVFHGESGPELVVEEGKGQQVLKDTQVETAEDDGEEVFSLSSFLDKEKSTDVPARNLSSASQAYLAMASALPAADSSEGQEVGPEPADTKSEVACDPPNDPISPIDQNSAISTTNTTLADSAPSPRLTSGIAAPIPDNHVDASRAVSSTNVQTASTLPVVPSKEVHVLPAADDEKLQTQAPSLTAPFTGPSFKLSVKHRFCGETGNQPAKATLFTMSSRPCFSITCGWNNGRTVTVLNQSAPLHTVCADSGAPTAMSLFFAGGDLTVICGTHSGHLVVNGVTTDKSRARYTKSFKIFSSTDRGAAAPLVCPVHLLQILDRNGFVSNSVNTNHEESFLLVCCGSNVFLFALAALLRSRSGPISSNVIVEKHTITSAGASKVIVSASLVRSASDREGGGPPFDIVCVDSLVRRSHLNDVYMSFSVHLPPWPRGMRG